MTDSIPWFTSVQMPFPDWLPPLIRQFLPPSVDQNAGNYAAQLLWQRGICQPDQVLSFLDARQYHPTDPFAFGAEMHRAVDRLQQAQQNLDKIALWGEAHPDGLTATAILWEGLRDFFSSEQPLTYGVFRHLTGSEGGLKPQLTQLADQGYRLLIACNLSGSWFSELQFAQPPGIDVILIDVHSPAADQLSAGRPSVTALLNPRRLPSEHPFSPLSGAAVAYKLLEALYSTRPDDLQHPSRLLDLVAIGLLAERALLTGECRYLAQQGIAVLQRNQDPVNPPRPGVAQLLELCRRSGDRPTDVSFGLAPRIKALSQLGEAAFCVELLTSQDRERCKQLARAAELANARRRALQRTVVQQVRENLATVDWSTTAVIVQVDAQWPAGILSFVATQIAQEYRLPTILLTFNPAVSAESLPLACGVARSPQAIDFYDLLQPQRHLLHGIGGNPWAVELSLPLENVPLFTAALNQQLRSRLPNDQLPDVSSNLRPANLQVTVAELGQSLFQELKLLEPCGLGNPVPRLLIQSCWFTRTWHRKIQDLTGKKLEYLKTEFELRDDSCSAGFPGVWWGHYKDELPVDRCDVLVELDFNSYEDTQRTRRYEVRLLAVRPHQSDLPTGATPIQIIDHRAQPDAASPANALVIPQSPSSWAEFQTCYNQAQAAGRALVLAYAAPDQPAPVNYWQQLVDLARSFSRTGQSVTAAQLQQRLGLGQQSCRLGLQALSDLGFAVTAQPQGWQITGQPQTSPTEPTAAMAAFLQAVQEEQFMQQYFVQAPLAVLQAAVSSSFQPAS